MEEWKKEVWHKYSMESYLVIRNDQVLPLVATPMELEETMLR